MTGPHDAPDVARGPAAPNDAAVTPRQTRVNPSHRRFSRLDIGCGQLDDASLRRYRRYLGQYEPRNYVRLDRKPVLGVTVVSDIAHGLPFKTETIEEILCIHVLEHVRDLESAMNEFHRVLTPGGILRVWTPHCFSPIAFGDSTHCRFFTFETLSQFDRRSPGSYYYDFHFKFLRSKIQLFRRWYEPNLAERVLEKLINTHQRRGERFLKILPYKDWEVYSELQKE